MESLEHNITTFHEQLFKYYSKSCTSTVHLCFKNAIFCFSLTNVKICASNSEVQFKIIDFFIVCCLLIFVFIFVVPEEHFHISDVVPVSGYKA